MNFFGSKYDQNYGFFERHIFVLTLFIRGLHTFWSIYVQSFDKILFKFFPQFLNLYASIYGMDSIQINDFLNGNESKLQNVKTGRKPQIMFEEL